MPLSREKPILSYEEMAEFVEVAVSMGIRKVRITGGEPLVRRDVVELVRMLASIPGVEDLSMTTNGTLLAPLAGPLKEAGLQRINISLDTLDPEHFERLTLSPKLPDALAGIHAAIAAGLHPVKLNCVIKESEDEPNAKQVAQFGKSLGLSVRFIREMNLESGEFWQVIGGKGGKCSLCNRLRLTCTGRLVPCLFSDIGFDIRELGSREAVLQAVANKPESGCMSRRNKFLSLGG